MVVSGVVEVWQGVVEVRQCGGGEAGRGGDAGCGGGDAGGVVPCVVAVGHGGGSEAGVAPCVVEVVEGVAEVVQGVVVPWADVMQGGCGR